MVSRLPSLEPSNVDVGNEDNNTASDNDNNAFNIPDQRNRNDTSHDKSHKTARNSAPGPLPWRVSAEMHRHITEACLSLHGVWPAGLTMPSRYTLSRYLEGYFRGFHEHMPFLHMPTFSAATATPELVLALAAVGALYRFEHAKGYELYKAADAIVAWRLGQTKADTLTHLLGCSPDYAGLVSSPQSSGSDRHFQQQQFHYSSRSQQQHPLSESTTAGNMRAEAGRGQGADVPIKSMDGMQKSRDEVRLNLLQAMVVLMALSSWGDRSMVPEALSISSHVSVLSHELGISHAEADISHDAQHTPRWRDWIAAESRRRTLFVAYVLTNLQSIALNVSPAILNQDIALMLPASGEEWNLATEQAWDEQQGQRRQRSQQLRLFRTTLDELIQGTPPHHDGPISAFGNYLLVHGLLQQIFFARQTVRPTATGFLSSDFIKDIEDALRAWQESWEATSESTLDPSSPKGPLGFNSSALLRLAHVRLNANVGPRRELITRDPQRIATALVDTQENMVLADESGGGGNKPTPHLDRAVLQCVHAFSVPVRVGIAYVARTQTLNWSIQHALCNLECALLLVRWLRAVANSAVARGFSTLYDDQVKLLNMTFTLVRETSLRDDVQADDQPYNNAHAQSQAQARRIRRLAAAVASLWTETFRGFHVFELVHVIGAAMSIVSDTLNNQLDEEGV